MEKTNCPAYRWRLLPGGTALEIEGPISRVPRKWRRRIVPLAQCPAILRSFFDDNAKTASTAASIELAIGKRTITVIRDQAESGFLIDQSRLHRRLAQARYYAHRIEEGINALPEAFVLYDTEDRLLIANPQYSALYPTIADVVRPGTSFAEIVDTSIRYGQMQFDGESPASWIRRRLAFHRQGVGFFEQHLSDGRWMRVSERRTASGGTTSIRSDITELKDREQALRAATEAAQKRSQSIERFLAIFSHEVRNGLNGIVGLAQTLASDARAKGEPSASDVLMESTHRLSTVLADLLEYLKSEATDFSITLGDVDPYFMMETIKALFEPRATERGLTLTTRVEDDVPAIVRGDPARIQQVMANLTSNAIKYSARGTISVTVRRQGERLRYEVEDEGIGIEDENLPGIFEFFSRSAPDHPLSTGLGLAISKKLVTTMGGTIGVESLAGTGSRFWFELPLTEVHRPAAVKPAAKAVLRPRPLTVGIIDDDELNRVVAAGLLRQLGHAPCVFSNGDELLAHLEAQPLDAVLLDVAMPVETGPQIASRIRASQNAAQSKMAILLATGNVLSDTLVDMSQCGIDAFLHKPLLLDTLESALQTAVSRHQHGSAAPVLSVPAPTPSDHDAHDAAQTRLDSLRAAIGTRRFIQSLHAADTLLSDTLSAISSKTFDHLANLSHRIAGNAAQLGFDALGETARKLETLLRAPENARHAAARTLPSMLRAMHTQTVDARQAVRKALLLHAKPSASSRRSR